jgi:hypothetical protein
MDMNSELKDKLSTQNCLLRLREYIFWELKYGSYVAYGVQMCILNPLHVSGGEVTITEPSSE